MTTELTVSAGTEKKFLEVAIAYGITHAILSDARRKELVEQSMTAYRYVVQMLQCNKNSMAEALSAARVTSHMLSIGLELKSGRDVAEATRVLLHLEPLSFVQEMIERIRRLHFRFKRFIKDQSGRFLLGHVERSVSIEFTHTLSLHETEGFELNNLWNIETLDELMEREAVMRMYENELLVSKKYFPWEKMLADGGFRRHNKNETYGQKQEVLFVLERELSWNIHTLCVTLYATYVTTGTPSTLISWTHAQQIIPQFGEAGFEDQMAWFGLEYARMVGCEFRNDEREVYQMIWRNAARVLCTYLPTKDRSTEMDVWYGKMHISMSSKEFGKEIDRADSKSIFFDTTNKIQPISLSRLLPEADTKEKRRMLLRNLDWTATVDSGEMETVLKYFEPSEVSEEIPLLASIVDSFCLFVDQLTDLERLRFLERLFVNASLDFWEMCYGDTLETLAYFTTPKSIGTIPMAPRFIGELAKQWEFVPTDRAFKNKDIIRLITRIVNNADATFWENCDSELKSRLRDFAPKHLKERIPQ